MCTQVLFSFNIVQFRVEQYLRVPWRHKFRHSLPIRMEKFAFPPPLRRLPLVIYLYDNCIKLVRVRIRRRRRLLRLIIIILVENSAVTPLLSSDSICAFRHHSSSLPLRFASFVASPRDDMKNAYVTESGSRHASIVELHVMSCCVTRQSGEQSRQKTGHNNSFVNCA